MDITKIVAPNATDNCNQPSVFLDKVYRIENGQPIALSSATWTALNADSFQLQWVAEDACVNQTKKDTITQLAIIEDKTKPSVICTDKLNISIVSNEIAIHYSIIDKGSWDACGIAKYELSRDEQHWDSIITVSCEDVHQEVKVFLRVTDAQGNSNTCWAILNVEDKIMPICSDLPAVTETCETAHIGKRLAPTDVNGNHQMEEEEWMPLSPAQIADFNENYGNPLCSDNVKCNNLTIEQAYQYIKKSCGRAEIKRRYRAIDWSGEGLASNWSEQSIHIEAKEDWTIELPADWQGECGEDIPASELIIKNGPCDLMGYEVTEKVFTTVEDACLKVVRTFTITNGCQDNTGAAAVIIPRIENHHGIVKENRTIKAADFANSGRLEYIQVLKLEDHTAPIIEVIATENCLTGTDCTDKKRFEITATDCNNMAQAQLKYNWTLSLEGVQIANGDKASFEANVAPNARYEVVWTVMDNCGNRAVERVNYEFKDCKKPSPICLHGIAVDLMENIGTVQVWAKDINQKSFDNCSAESKLDYRIWHASIGAVPTNLSEVKALPENITFSCTYLGNQEVGLYLIDEAGNWDYCLTYVNVQDNTLACNGLGGENKALVSGIIKDWKDRTVEQVEVAAAPAKTMMTESDGYYHFDLTMHQDYSIVPEKLINPLNGVSTFDLVLITKHILGKTEFTNPYQQIAADVNKSGSITAFDMVQLRKLILNIDSDFQNNTSWRFVDAAYEFSTDNPLTEAFPEKVVIENLSKEVIANFVAIKVGDVSGNARVNSFAQAEPRTNSNKFKVQVEERTVKAGENYTISFSTKQLAQIQGYQFTINFDDLLFNSLKTKVVALENFGLHKAAQGQITTSWNVTNKAVTTDSNQGEGTKQALFEIVFTALYDGKLSEQIKLSDRPTTIEAYDETGALMEVELEFINTQLEETLELYQNEPNPFYGKTNIGFYLPGDSPVKLILRDETGRILKVYDEERNKGHNQFLLEESDLANGIIYYQIITKYGSKARKMLHLR
jgi:hypothetical protein